MKKIKIWVIEWEEGGVEESEICTNETDARNMELAYKIDLNKQDVRVYTTGVSPSFLGVTNVKLYTEWEE